MNNRSTRSAMGASALTLSVAAALLGLPSTASAIPTLYGITGDGGVPPETLFTINTTTAAATSFLTLGAGNDGEAIALNPADGLMYHASGISSGVRFWEQIDLSVPSVASSVALGGVNENLAMTWNPSTGTFLVSNRDNTVFYSITTAGAITDIGSTPEDLKGLAFAGGTLYGAAVFDNLLYTLNPLNGAPIVSIPVTLLGFTVDGLNGLATDPDTDQLFAILRSGLSRRLATIDPITGVATDIGVITGGTGWAGLAFGPGGVVVVPEPSTLTILGVGLLGLGALRRRRKARA